MNRNRSAYLVIEELRQVVEVREMFVDNWRMGPKTFLFADMGWLDE